MWYQSIPVGGANDAVISRRTVTLVEYLAGFHDLNLHFGVAFSLTHLPGFSGRPTSRVL